MSDACNKQWFINCFILYDVKELCVSLVQAILISLISSYSQRAVYKLGKIIKHKHVSSSSREGYVPPFFRKVQVVNYNITSSSDAEDEPASCNSFVMSSRHLSPPHLTINRGGGGGSSSSSNDEEDEISARKRRRTEMSPDISVDSETLGTALGEQARWSPGAKKVSGSPDWQPLEGEHSRTSCSDEGGSVRRANSDTRRVEIPAAGETSATTAPQRRKYALKESQLPDDMRTSLGTVRSFFTRKHSLQRQGMNFAETTFAKCLERFYCEYILL